MTEITDFDTAEYLDSEEKIADYLSSVIEENDWSAFLLAVGNVAKARGMSNIAKETGLGRESLYKAFNANTQPKFETVMRVLNALHISIQLQPTSDNITRPIRDVNRSQRRKRIAA